MLMWGILDVTIILMVGVALYTWNRSQLLEIDRQIEELAEEIPEEVEEVKQQIKTHYTAEEAKEIDWKNVKFK